MFIITGMPYLNFLCIVLWCQSRIPTQAPMLPPMTAIISSIASDMRHLTNVFLCILTVVKSRASAIFKASLILLSACRRLKRERSGLRDRWDYEFRLQEKIEVRIPKEDLASHTARRTFVVTAYNKGVPLDLIMLITSHSDVKAMKPYLKGNLKGSNRVIEALNKASH